MVEKINLRDNYFGTRKYLISSPYDISKGPINSLLAESHLYASRLINGIDALKGEDVIVLYSRNNTPAHKITYDFINGIFIRGKIDKVVQSGPSSNSSICLLTFQKNTNNIVLPEIDLKYIYDVVNVKDINAHRNHPGTLDTLKIFRFCPLTQDKGHQDVEINQYEAFSAFRGVESGYRNIPMTLISIDELVGKMHKLND